jgi:hypothetical protein
MSDYDRKVILDNVVLSNFLLVKQEQVLSDLLSGRMWVTQEVLAESAAGRSAGMGSWVGSTVAVGGTPL